MGIWVRSQDRKDLVIINHVFISSRLVMAITKEKSKITLGEYASEGRVLQIVDQIQHRLITGCRTDVILTNVRIYKEIVFEMPEQ